MVVKMFEKVFLGQTEVVVGWSMGDGMELLLKAHWATLS